MPGVWTNRDQANLWPRQRTLEEFQQGTPINR
jgi:hypothetical protein